MSSFYGSPKGPHIGECGNFIMPSGISGQDGYYCLAPVLGLGGEFVTDRDICGGCRMHSEAFRERILAAHIRGFQAEPEAGWVWVETSRRILADMDLGWFQRAARGASMEELTKIKADIRYREGLLEAVLDCLPPMVDTSQSLL